LKFIVPSSCKPYFLPPFQNHCLLLNSIHALCNQSQICGFKLLILKSTLNFLPSSIYCLMTPNV
jgi:hypothetical protein